MDEKQVVVNGRNFTIKLYRDYGKLAIARIRGDTIHIKIPRHWNTKAAEEAVAKLEKRMLRRIISGSIVQTEPRFHNGQIITAFGEDLTVEIFSSGRKALGRIFGNSIMINLPEDAENKDELVVNLVKRLLVKKYLPAVSARVHELDALFNSPIGKISLRMQSSRWGSCSLENNISINVLLLLLPKKILDYVIVHELAHTKVRDHSPRFWKQVEIALPDFEERRKWLKKEARKRLAEIFDKE